VVVVFFLLVGVERGGQAEVVADASSELTMRTTASVDVQVCAPGVLTEERAAVAAAVLTTLRYLLMQTTAVYLVREYTTAVSGDMCLLYVYQAPSPTAAAYTEVLLAQQVGVPVGALSVSYTSATGASVTAVCALAVSQWQGEDAPLPLLPSVTADDLLLWGAIGGGGLAVAVVVACLCVLCTIGCHHTPASKKRAHHHHHHPTTTTQGRHTRSRSNSSSSRGRRSHHHHHQPDDKDEEEEEETSRA
jgi:hypothetical protein